MMQRYEKSSTYARISLTHLRQFAPICANGGQCSPRVDSAPAECRNFASSNKGRDNTSQWPMRHVVGAHTTRCNRPYDSMLQPPPSLPQRGGAQMRANNVITNNLLTY